MLPLLRLCLLYKGRLTFNPLPESSDDVAVIDGDGGRHSNDK